MSESYQDCPRSLFPASETQSLSNAFEVGGQREASFQLSRYEANVLLDHYVTHIVEIEAPQEFLQLHCTSDYLCLDDLERRLSNLIDCGLLTLDKAKAQYVRARELRGLQLDRVRQKREEEKGQFTLFFNLTEFQPDEILSWVDEQKARGVVVNEQFAFGTVIIKPGRYDVIGEKGWSLPDSHPRWQDEITYAWAGPVDDRDGLNLKTELEKHAGEWDQSGHCWWVSAEDMSDLPNGFDPETAAEEHAAWVADQPVVRGPEFAWSMI